MRDRRSFKVLHFQVHQKHDAANQSDNLTRGELLVPRARLAIKQRRAFSVVSPSIWNDLPPRLRFLLVIHPTGFYKSLKTFSLVVAGPGALLSSFLKGRYINDLNE